jgi:hypothetical protein
LRPRALHQLTEGKDLANDPSKYPLEKLLLILYPVQPHGAANLHELHPRPLGDGPDGSRLEVRTLGN